ncbi:MAG: hypothetical protein ABF785_11875 [Acetobacter papayae]|uniref:hypothetical protein n=1 Tax=Acetobacter papayae TaxID=1076592 RepID=UPI0039EA143E
MSDETDANLSKTARQIYSEALDNLIDKIFKTGIDHRSPTPDLRVPEATKLKKIILNAIKSHEVGQGGVERDIQDYVEKIAKDNSVAYLKKYPEEKPADEAMRLQARAPARRAAVVSFLNFLFSKQ